MPSDEGEVGDNDLRVVSVDTASSRCTGNGGKGVRPSEIDGRVISAVDVVRFEDAVDV